MEAKKEVERAPIGRFTSGFGPVRRNTEELELSVLELLELHRGNLFDAHSELVCRLFCFADAFVPAQHLTGVVVDDLLLPRMFATEGNVDVPAGDILDLLVVQLARLVDTHSNSPFVTERSASAPCEQGAEAFSVYNIIRVAGAICLADAALSICPARAT